MKTKKYAANEKIIVEGTKGSEIFFIKSGKAKVYKTLGSEVVDLGTLKKGDFFGELCCFLGHERTATVQALEDTEVLIGDKKSFFNAMKKNPSQAESIIITLARRLVAAHKVISEIQDAKVAYKLIFQPFMEDFK